MYQLWYLRIQNVPQNHNNRNLKVFYVPFIHIITRSADGQRAACKRSANSLTIHWTGSAGDNNQNVKDQEIFSEKSRRIRVETSPKWTCKFNKLQLNTRCIKRRRTVKYLKNIAFSEKMFSTKVTRFQEIYLSFNFSTLRKKCYWIYSISVREYVYYWFRRICYIRINKSASNSIYNIDLNQTYMLLAEML